MTEAAESDKRITNSAAIPGGWMTSSVLGALVVVGALLSTVVGAVTLFEPARFLVIVGQPEQQPGSAALVFASYAGARELAIGLAVLLALAARSPRVLAGIAFVAALANGTDALLAVTAERWEQVPGALLFALVYAAYAFVLAHPIGLPAPLAWWRGAAPPARPR